ncbi:MAG: L-arabinose isomerase, partial [Candidatus Limnocylindrales bacterium]
MAFEGSQIWFLTGSQDLYGEVILEAVKEQSTKMVAGLNAADALPVQLVHKPTVTTPDGIRRACIEASADDSVIGVIGWMHTFSPAKMWISGLQALTKPFLHLHTQHNADLPYGTIDMEFMNLNQSAHGDREFAYIVSRLRMPRKTVAGHWQDPAVQGRIGSWMRAAAGVHEARGLRCIRFGDNMREVADTDGDKVEVQARFGTSCNTYPVNELAATVDQVSDAEVDRLCAEYDDLYDVVPELRVGGERRESLRDAARIELGLRAFLGELGSMAFVDTFQDLGGLKQLPGIGAQRLMADGYGFGPEGDWKTSILVRLVKVMGQGLEGGSSLMEDYTYDFGADATSVLGAHMLEVCPTIAGAKPSCEIHPLFVGEREDPVRLVFTGAAGPGVVVGMVDMGTHLRLLANEVDAIDAPIIPVVAANTVHSSTTARPCPPLILPSTTYMDSNNAS